MAKYVKQLKYVKRHSFGSADSPNMIIHGDNNIILDILQERLKEKIKCIYIDPPYNNGEQYIHYKDIKTHEDWLREMTNIMHKLKYFLQEDGTLWISIDESEMHYLKVAADKVFGRQNFITTIIWQQRTSRENRKLFSNNHEYILVYARNPKKFKVTRNMLPPTKSISSRYKNPDSNPRGPWQSISANVQAGHAVKSQFYTLIAPNGKRHFPPKGRCWVYNKSRMNNEIKANNVWFGYDGNGVPRIKKFLSTSKIGITPETIWLGNDVGTTKMAKKHLLKLFPDNEVFDTPKPETLIKRILDISTNEGDMVMDVYLGSGTTAAVAHKMKRNYVGVEIGNHVIDYVVARMKKVVCGEPDGISNDVGWSGGGTVGFYQLK